MSEPKHTPEPWDNHGLTIWQKWDGRKIGVMSGASLDPEENAANTDLVKAAPELLAALETVNAFLECQRCHPDWPCIDHDGWEKGIAAAIAKARGET